MKWKQLKWERKTKFDGKVKKPKENMRCFWKNHCTTASESACEGYEYLWGLWQLWISTMSWFEIFKQPIVVNDGWRQPLRQKHEWHHSCRYRLQKLKVIVVATKYARRSNNGHPFSLFYAICHLWQQWDISFSNFINSSISGNNLMILKFWILLVPFWILKYGDSTEDLWKNSRPLFTSRPFEKNDIHRWQDRNNVGYGIIYQQGQE